MTLALLLKQSQDLFVSQVCLDRHIFKWFIGDYYVHCAKSTHLRNLASQERFYFMIQAVCSLPSQSPVTSAIHFPIFLLLLSYSLPWTPALQTQTMVDSNRPGPQDITFLPFSPALHLCIPKGFGMRRPEFTRARIHLEPLRATFVCG